MPKIRVLPEFSRLAHGLRSGNISILDTKTFYIPNLHYDGTGPDAYFWVGTGREPNTFGVKVPSETKRFAQKLKSIEKQSDKIFETVIIKRCVCFSVWNHYEGTKAKTSKSCCQTI